MAFPIQTQQQETDTGAARLRQTRVTWKRHE
jgi:hypothetical protein